MSKARGPIVENIRQVLRQFVEYEHKEAKTVYAQRSVDRDALQFFLHLPIMVEIEVSGVLSRSIQKHSEAQKLVDEILRILNNKKSDLNRISREMTAGGFVFPGYEPDTVMEFSL